MKLQLHKLLTESTTNIWVQFFRYFFVGGTAFIVDFGTLALLTGLGVLGYQGAAAAGFCLGLVANYLLSIRWVFDKHASTTADAMADFIGFAIVGVIGLGLNALFMWYFTEMAHCHYLISKIISTGLVFLWNFLGRRILINKLTILWVK